MTCVEGEAVCKIMKEIHGGSCGNHFGGRTLAIKIKRHGFFWSTMIKDCEIFSMRCARANNPSASRILVINRLVVSIYAMVNGYNWTYASL